MFSWNSIPLWGAGLTAIAVMVALGVIFGPIGWLHERWRNRHPKREADWRAMREVTHGGKRWPYR